MHFRLPILSTLPIASARVLLRFSRKHVSSSEGNRVFWLKSGDIFRNLAFETTLFSNRTRYALSEAKSPHSNRAVDVLLWISDPCVVMGRNQNVWCETNPSEIESRRWKLARRMSGGGSVFHDQGNLNISFIESRSTLDRRRCMEFLQQTLMLNWPSLEVLVGPRYDLWLLPCPCSAMQAGNVIPETAAKISGAASRFSSDVGLHHCTLLFDANLSHLSNVLSPALKNVQTKASQSVSSKVKNIGISGEELVRVILEASQRWIKKDSLDCSPIIHVIHGEEDRWLDGEIFNKNLELFQSWDWIYGSSPKFSIPVLSNSDALFIDCEKGRFFGFRELESTELSHWLAYLSSFLKGQPCIKDAWITALERYFSSNPQKLNDTESSAIKCEVIQKLRNLAASF